MKWSLLVLSLIVIAGATSARAETKWEKKHPRRAEVNGRLKNQNKRINEGVKDGKLTADQAKQLKSEDKSIRHQERADAAQNGGHITKAEQKQLNQEENKASKDIYGEKHPSPAPATTTPPAATPAGQ